VSGVYYGIDVLPGWLQACSRLAPTTYLLKGIRAAVIDGVGVGGQLSTLATLAGFGLVMIPASLAAFSGAERWAKKTGRLKRLG
jgi:ABC-2 type transport system permease protein